MAVPKGGLAGEFLDGILVMKITGRI